MKKVTLWQLFYTFFKIGLFTFGGGYAMISIMEKEVVAKRKWATDADMLDMLVIAESTPGVLAVNTATSIGYRTRGVLGAIVGTLGVVLPSFMIIFGLSFLIDAFQDNMWYKSAFYGIQVCVCYMIINAFVKMFRQLEKNIFNIILMLVAFGVCLFTTFNVIYIILCGAVIGLVYSLIMERHNNKKGNLPVTQLMEEKLDDKQSTQDTPTDDSAQHNTIDSLTENTTDAHNSTPNDSDKGE